MAMSNKINQKDNKVRVFLQLNYQHNGKEIWSNRKTRSSNEDWS